MTEEDVELESTPVWMAKTIGYVVLAVFAAIVLINAFQSFFWERTWGPVTGGVGGAVGILVARARRHRWARARKPEEPT